MIRLLCGFAALLAFVGVAQSGTSSAEGIKGEATFVPTALSPSDVKRYKAIFAAQERGAWKTADTQIRALENKLLLGYVLEQRYMHPTAYRASYRELSRWLSAYADHTNAAPVYRLAKRRQARNLAPRRPTGRRWRQDNETPLHPKLAADYANSSRRADVRRIERRLRYLTRNNRPAQALNYLNDRKQFNALTAAQTDRVRGWIAASFYYDGDLRRAQRVADQALKRSWDSAVLSHWIAGLVAWRQDDAERAYEHFAAQADIPYQEEELRAAAAFWAARAALASGKTEPVTDFLTLASGYPLTFYGQLALGQLGMDAGIDWNPPILTKADYNHIAETAPRVERAVGLAQVGQITTAEEEMKWAHGEVADRDDAALAALAAALRLPSAQLVLAQSSGADKTKNAHLRAGLYPIPDYAPNGGFTLDPALLYGLMRQESKFMRPQTTKVSGRSN